MTLSIQSIGRRFGDTVALAQVSLEVKPGEFVALLGPSGSGKTTLLRILAGLDYPDTGKVSLDGDDFLATDARKRGVGLVFQHYALFRHMTVAENIAFGLRVRPWRLRPRRAEIASRVSELLLRVRLDGFGSRYPAQLSGGQRQRVALARALAVEPQLLLLDEPFGALDAQVRTGLRRRLRELQEELGLSTVLVTHDQVEALELADRVAVMNNGVIEQVGTPEEVYFEPATPFVCEFIGRVNRVAMRRGTGGLSAAGWVPRGEPWHGHYPHATAYIRPEHLEIGAQDAPWQAVVRHVYLAGSIAHLDLDVSGVGTLEADVASEDLARRNLAVGAQVSVSPARSVLFAGESARWSWQAGAGP